MLWDQPVVVLAALLPAIVVPHLLDLAYWRYDMEVLVIGGGALLIGLVLSLVERKMRRLAGLLIAIAVYWMLDVYFDKSGFASAALLSVTAVALASRFGEDVRRMIIVFAVFWLGSNLLTPSRPLLDPELAPAAPPSRDSELPPIVHVVLDEQMSPMAVPDSIPPGSSAHSIISDYLQRGFRVHTKASSSSPWSRLALGQLVSFRLESPWVGISRDQLWAIEATPNPSQDLFTMLDGGLARVARNVYFERLRDLGYVFTTIQSAHLDFCLPNPTPGDECHIYRTYEHGHAMSLRPVSSMDRLALALGNLRFGYLLGTSVHGVTLYQLIALATGERLRWKSQARPMAMLEILDRLRTRLGDLQRGRAYFVHLLLPHEPYALDANCTLRDRSQWLTYRDNLSTEDAYRGYWAQTMCTHSRIMDLVDLIRASPNGQDAVLLVHGDHGSRISYYHTVDTARVEDGPDMLMTFLAVRMPKLDSGEVTEAVNLQRTFGQVVDSLEAELRADRASRP